jgi:hypothetical protein
MNLNDINDINDEEVIDEELIFSDGQKTIDYVLVYCNSLRAIPSERSLIVSRIRQQFIKVLCENYNIQIKEVYIKNNT